ncbi:hypothetical protein A3G67_00465 [Candidatus Roizmanbacteria bacterium RIFCSPLOWO2_12_FULL_40_12]|nr:MAG: hypothetical protein A2W49_01400 [Candidatus Roizmanbacteria bacterium RIFCSPHIGHO2_12_41_18]OGK58449.1 MAG: hypothetical protein A3H84_04060 [Candidatus Roizmanbacteria bacterium RIFCSPLOWO2_02_FULL_40_13]OGK60340.1 MAG: hypothetical protein A3G67_00465 [Candidatus Roizmanbacteria bacterium RIFCSPLOWO2_12_FULL_40_12]
MANVENGPQRARVLVRPQEHNTLARRTTVVDEWTEIDLIVDGKRERGWKVNKWLTKRGYDRRVKRKAAKVERKAEKINNPPDSTSLFEMAQSVDRQKQF